MGHASVEVFIGLGANLGDCRDTLLWALKSIMALPETSLARVSSLYMTAPVDAKGPDYWNAVAQIRTHLPAPVLLRRLQALESDTGRKRPYVNAPRTLDLDVLLYGSAVIASRQLTVPHPRMFQRAFVMAPLAELKSDILAAEQLSRLCADQDVRVIDRDWFTLQS
jgi:2-amino-4-hydroxy-6-hydroxymethyldihydropteridine diphosphokinase